MLAKPFQSFERCPSSFISTEIHKSYDLYN